MITHEENLKTITDRNINIGRRYYDSNNNNNVMRYNYGHPTYGNNRRNDRYWSNDLKAYMTYEDWKQLSSEERSRRHRDLENSNNPGKQSQKMV